MRSSDHLLYLVFPLFTRTHLSTLQLPYPFSLGWAIGVCGTLPRPYSLFFLSGLWRTWIGFTFPYYPLSGCWFWTLCNWDGAERSHPDRYLHLLPWHGCEEVWEHAIHSWLGVCVNNCVTCISKKAQPRRQKSIPVKNHVTASQSLSVKPCPLKSTRNSFL